METRKVELENGTVLEVGGTITNKHWEEGDYATITAIGKKLFLASHKDTNAGETAYLIDTDNWMPYTAPTPEKEWKTFLIEFSEIQYRCILQYKTLEQAQFHHPNAKSIEEIKINFEVVKP